MKPLLLFVAAMAGGCADPLEQHTTQEVSSQLERGVTGQGTIGPESRLPNDTASEHGVPQSHP
jgi:hypothetical protein